MRANISEGKNITANETDVNFEYIPHERYIIEIKDKESGRTYHTRRIGTLRYAVNAADEYSSMAAAQEMKDEHKFLRGMSARIHDTMTGEII